MHSYFAHKVQARRLCTRCSVLTGALRLVIYEGQEAPAGGRSGGRRAAVAAADLAAADVVRAIMLLPLDACMLCCACVVRAVLQPLLSKCVGACMLQPNGEPLCQLGPCS